MTPFSIGVIVSCLALFVGVVLGWIFRGINTADIEAQNADDIKELKRAHAAHVREVRAEELDRGFSDCLGAQSNMKRGSSGALAGAKLLDALATDRTRLPQ